MKTILTSLLYAIVAPLLAAPAIAATFRGTFSESLANGGLLVGQFEFDDRDAINGLVFEDDLTFSGLFVVGNPIFGGAMNGTGWAFNNANDVPTAFNIPSGTLEGKYGFERFLSGGVFQAFTADWNSPSVSLQALESSEPGAETVPESGIGLLPIAGLTAIAFIGRGRKC